MAHGVIVAATQDTGVTSREEEHFEIPSLLVSNTPVFNTLFIKAIRFRDEGARARPTMHIPVQSISKQNVPHSCKACADRCHSMYMYTGEGQKKKTLVPRRQRQKPVSMP